MELRLVLAGVTLLDEHMLRQYMRAELWKTNVRSRPFKFVTWMTLATIVLGVAGYELESHRLDFMAWLGRDAYQGIQSTVWGLLATSGFAFLCGCSILPRWRTNRVYIWADKPHFHMNNISVPLPESVLPIYMKARSIFAEEPSFRVSFVGDDPILFVGESVYQRHVAIAVWNESGLVNLL